MTIAHLPNWRRMWKIHFIEFAMWKCLEHSSAAHCTRRRVAWYNRSTDGDDRGGPPTIAMHCWSPTIGNTIARFWNSIILHCIALHGITLHCIVECRRPPTADWPVPTQPNYWWRPLMFHFNQPYTILTTLIVWFVHICTFCTRIVNFCTLIVKCFVPIVNLCVRWLRYFCTLVLHIDCAVKDSEHPPSDGANCNQDVEKEQSQFVINSSGD